MTFRKPERWSWKKGMLFGGMAGALVAGGYTVWAVCAAAPVLLILLCVAFFLLMLGVAIYGAWWRLAQGSQRVPPGENTDPEESTPGVDNGRQEPSSRGLTRREMFTRARRKPVAPAAPIRPSARGRCCPYCSAEVEKFQQHCPRCGADL